MAVEENVVLLLSDQKSKPKKVHCETFFVVYPFYFAYATLFGLQHQVKERLGIEDDASHASYMFGFVISLQYVFNLIFRFMHGVVFSHLSSRERVFAAMFTMIFSMLLLASPLAGGLPEVMVAYALGGIAIGTFEPNFLSCITHLGHETKSWAILGIPFGVSSLLIGGFLSMGPPLDAPARCIYAFTVCILLVGIAIMAFAIPGSQLSETSSEPSSSGFCRYPEWLPQVWSQSLAYFVNMLTVALVSPGVWLYIFDEETVTVFPEWYLATDLFFSLLNTFNMLGSVLGRWLSYHCCLRHPLMYIVFSFAGVFLMFLKIPLLLPLASFLVMFADGLIYGSVSRHIDDTISKDLNLISISYWCLNGDVGAIIGTNLIPFLRGIMVSDP